MTDFAPLALDAAPKARLLTESVTIGDVRIGGGAPIVVQSMTNTDTADVEGTARQVAALARAGSELVRITVDRDEAAAAVPKIRDRLVQMNVNVPLIGDFHYIGHKLLSDHPACAEALDKYRINPGNVGFKSKKDRQFSTIVELAAKYDKAVRIGANWGSLDGELLTRLMDENATSDTPIDARAVTREAMVQSALLSAARAEEIGLPKNKIILSAKVSAVQDLIAVYRMLAARSTHALHLGLTEAGMGSKGIVASSAALGVLMQEGIGDTIRISLTPEHGVSHLYPAGCSLPGMRTHDLDRFSGTGARHSGLYPRFHARLERPVCGRGKSQWCGDGLHRQRARRIETCRYRHFAARHRRGSDSTCFHRRPESHDPARGQYRTGIQDHRAGLYRKALRFSWLAQHQCSSSAR